MRLWGKLLVSGEKVAESLVEINIIKRAELRNHREVFDTALTELAKSLDISRPIIMKKHYDEMQGFSRTSFSPSDFLDAVLFDRFTVEIIP